MKTDYLYIMKLSKTSPVTTPVFAACSVAEVPVSVIKNVITKTISNKIITLCFTSPFLTSSYKSKQKAIYMPNEKHL